ncbi:hypothetical protein PQO03_09355 [Lentisphaera profundi]|uniref:Uncharacterized protein n=1 Tax=Lentisphaera profundi TaxID=1658616 RepID=A0ABY7VRQ5_9BACT|nr:hypothetical protein [Lentisphaera profundi]WDE95920.1 hypothetical protein PQO03_09355 [Lentisphaera profundi]
MKKLITCLMVLSCLANNSFAEDDHKDHDHSKHEEHKGHDKHKGHDHDKHEGHDDHDHGEHKPHPGHGGETLKVGTSALLWYAHMGKSGEFIIVLFKSDGKTPKSIEKAPRLNLALKSGRKQLKFIALKADSEGKSSTFELKSDLLKAHIHGQISIKVDGKSHILNLIDHH